MNPSEVGQLAGDLQTFGVNIPDISIVRGGSAGGQVLANAINETIKNALLNSTTLSLSTLATAIIEIAPLAILVEGWSRVTQAQQEQSFADANFSRYLADRARARQTIDEYIDGVAILAQLRRGILATKKTYWDLEATISIPHTYGSPGTRKVVYQTHTQKDVPYSYPVTVWVQHVPKAQTKYVTGHHVHVVDEYQIPPNNSGLDPADYKMLSDWMVWYLVEEPKRPDIAQAQRYAASQFWSEVTNQSHHMLEKMYEAIYQSYANLSHFNKVISMLALRVAQAQSVSRAEQFIAIHQYPLDKLTFKLFGVNI